VPNVAVCMEIPFIDGAEGACSWTVNGKSHLISHNKWVKIRPTMIMIESKYWSQIRLEWKKACRLAGQECNIALDSVDSTIKSLDNLLNQYFD